MQKEPCLLLTHWDSRDETQNNEIAPQVKLTTMSMSSDYYYEMIMLKRSFLTRPVGLLLLHGCPHLRSCCSQQQQCPCLLFLRVQAPKYLRYRPQIPFRLLYMGPKTHYLVLGPAGFPWECSGSARSEKYPPKAE